MLIHTHTHIYALAVHYEEKEVLGDEIEALQKQLNQVCACVCVYVHTYRTMLPCIDTEVRIYMNVIYVHVRISISKLRCPHPIGMHRR